MGLGSIVKGAGDAFGIYNGINSGTPVGYASAAVNAGKLANVIGGKGTVPGASAAGDVLGIYNGLKSGGVAGYGSAALNSYQLYNDASSLLGAGASAGAAGAGAGAAAGAAGAGATEAGAAAGAGLGATIGQYVPVIGTLLGAYLSTQTPAVEYTPKYWNNVQNSLQQAISSGDKGQIAAQVNGLLSQDQKTIPANIQQLVYQTGMVPSIGWGQQYTPTQFQDANNILQQAKSKGPTGGKQGKN